MDFSAVIAEELNLEVWRVAKALELMDQDLFLKSC